MLICMAQSFLAQSGPIKRVPDGAVVDICFPGRRCAPALLMRASAAAYGFSLCGAPDWSMSQRAPTAYGFSTQWHEALFERLFSGL